MEGEGGGHWKWVAEKKSMEFLQSLFEVKSESR